MNRNLLTQTDARGCITTLSYDGLNRLKDKVYSGSRIAMRVGNTRYWLFSLYSSNFDLSNKWNAAPRDMFKSEVDGYLRDHPGYDDRRDSNLQGWDKILFGQLRYEYWLERAEGDMVEASYLLEFYDYHQQVMVQEWDSSRVDWKNVGIDAVSFGLSFIGLNTTAQLGRLAPLANTVATGNAIYQEDAVGTALGFGSYWPGPPGVIASGASVLKDLWAGVIQIPYKPSVTR